MMSRLARIATAGVLAAGLGAGAFGVASAATTPSPASSAGAKAPAAKAHHKGLLKRALHGTFAVTRKGAVATVAVQRGEVTAVTPASVTLKSQDGYVATYTVGKDTKVRSAGTATTLGTIKVGSHATITAVKSGATFTASRLVARSAVGAKGAAPSSSPSA